nr:hypothetical protein [Endozoicomonas sp.]
MNRKINDKLKTIVRDILLLNDLETTHSAEDFPEVAVWSLKNALEKAYEQGALDTLAITEQEVTKATGWVPVAVKGLIDQVRKQLDL